MSCLVHQRFDRGCTTIFCFPITVCLPRNNSQNDRRAYPPCYFLKAAMISKVPVVWYLVLNQSCRQPQRFRCQSSQISDHCVVLGLIISISAFRKKHDCLLTLLRAKSKRLSFRFGRLPPKQHHEQKNEGILTLTTCIFKHKSLRGPSWQPYKVSYVSNHE